MKKYARKCSQCDNLMNEGYVIEQGEAYYCSDKCLYKNMSKKKYLELFDDGDGDSYWTAWEDEDDTYYYEDGTEVEG